MSDLVLWLSAIRADFADGLTPPDAWRPLFTWEQHVDFAEIDDDLAEAYRRTENALQETRNAILDAMTNAWDLPADESEKLARAIREFGAAQNPQVREAVDAAVRDIADTMASVNHRAATGLIREAGRQLVTPTRELSLVRAARYEDLAGIGPSILWSRLTAAAQQVVTPTVTPAEAIGAAERAPVGQAQDAARQAAHVAHGEGRAAAIETMPTPSRIYASELLDGRTCSRCAKVDGREYESLAAAYGDYPAAGPYWNCKGGARCRGTLVVVWDGQTPGDQTPTGPRFGPDRTGPRGESDRPLIDIADVPVRRPKPVEPEPARPAREPIPEVVDDVPAPAAAEPPKLRDPKDLTDAELEDDLADVMGRLSGDTADLEALEAHMDRLILEIDLRETAIAEAEQARITAEMKREAKRERDRERAAERREQKRAERDAADSEANRRVGELIDDGMDEIDAIAEAFGVSTDSVARTQAIGRLRADGYTGRGFDELARQAWADEVDRLYALAESREGTLGNLLNNEARRINEHFLETGRGRYIDDRLLFAGGSEAFVAKWASPELDRWFKSIGGRKTFASFRDELLTGRHKGPLYEGTGA